MSIAGRRAVLSLPQAALAAEAGISRQALSAIESGTIPSTTVALRLARALGCRVEDLFDLEQGRRRLAVELAGSGALEADAQGAGGAGRPGASVAGRPGASVAGRPGASGAGRPGANGAGRPGASGAGRPGASGAGRPGGRASPQGSGRRVALANIAGRWVAHPLADDPAIAADALAPGGATSLFAVEPLRDEVLLRRNLLVLGCDPALGILSARLADRHARLRWLHAPSEAALEGLRRGHAHVAGIHLFDEETSRFNAPFVRRALPGASLLPLARWELGFVVARKNPLGIREARDVLRRGVRLVNREPGSGGRKLLDRVLLRAGVRKPGRDVLIACGHQAVAEAVALGAADVGVATRAAAEARDLHFLPLSEERFDLVLPAGALEDDRIGWLVDALASRTFRRELSALRGYRAAKPEVTAA